MKKVILFIVLLQGLLNCVNAQTPYFVNRYKIRNSGYLHDLRATPYDSGFILMGATVVPNPNYQADIFLVKQNENGDTLWSKLLRAGTSSHGYQIATTSDSGFIITGRTGYTHSPWAAHLIKLDRNGNEQWAKTYYTDSGTIARSVKQTSDGGYIIAGITYPTSTIFDGFLVRTNSAGDTLWTRVYGGSSSQEFLSVVEMPDGGFAITGYDTRFNVASKDVLVLRTNSIGDTLWTRIYGNAQTDIGHDIQLTNDGGLILAAEYIAPTHNTPDFSLLKLTTNGVIQWMYLYGCSSLQNDRPYALRQTTDHGFLVAGLTNSPGIPRSDWLLLKTDSNGAVQWNSTFGDHSDWDNIAYGLDVAGDGRIILGGYWSPSIGDTGELAVVKTDSLGFVPCLRNNINIVTTTVAPNTNKGMTLRRPAFDVDTLTFLELPTNSIEHKLCVVGIDEIENIDCLTVFPNPTTDKIYIKAGGKEVKSVMLFNNMGLRLYSTGKVTGDFSMDVSGYPSGLYNLVVSVNGSCKKVSRFIISK
jgi:hypothetical protein